MTAPKIVKALQTNGQINRAGGGGRGSQFIDKKTEFRERAT